MSKKYKDIISYYKPYKKIFFADMFFEILVSAINLAIPLIIRYLTSSVIYYPGDEAIRWSLICGAGILVLILMHSYCSYFISYRGHLMGAKIERDMRFDLFKHYQGLPLNFFDNQKIGQLMSRVTIDLGTISKSLHRIPEDVALSSITLIGAFSILMSINWILAVISILSVPFIMIYARYNLKKMKVDFIRCKEKIAKINGQMEDSLSGIRVVKSFGNEDIEIKKFKAANDSFVDSKRKNLHTIGKYYGGYTALIFGLVPMIVVLGSVLISKGIVSVSDLITFILYVNTFITPIYKLLDVAEDLEDAASGYTRFREIMKITPEKDKENAVELQSVSGSISFKNVSFGYSEGKKDTLSNINIDIKSGEYVAVVGQSGVGKSTICNLIPRFYSVSSGMITIDKINIENIKLSSLRSNIGIVQQDVYLFGDTIKENIRYGKQDASDEEIIAAAKHANIHDFIVSLPDGYDTDVGERGVKLSGGQKQRLSIARVFLKNPKILIFDEATSSLDNESERLIQDSLEQLSKDRTTIVIAHRLSTILNADRILVLDKNGIVENGTHKNLMSKNGVYASLYRLQVRNTA